MQTSVPSLYFSLLWEMIDSHLRSILRNLLAGSLPSKQSTSAKHKRGLISLWQQLQPVENLEGRLSARGCNDGDCELNYLRSVQFWNSTTEALNFRHGERTYTTYPSLFFGSVPLRRAPMRFL